MVFSGREEKAEVVCRLMAGWCLTDRVEQLFPDRSDRSILSCVGRVFREYRVSGIWLHPHLVSASQAPSHWTVPFPFSPVSAISGSPALPPPPPPPEWLSSYQLLLEASKQLPKHSRDPDFLPLDQWEEKKTSLRDSGETEF